MTTRATHPRLTSFAAQFLVDDLARSISYYQKIGFTFGDPWDGFYAIGERDGLELHLKEAPKNVAERRHRRDNEHLDAATAWGTRDFYIEDPDGYVIAFGGRSAERREQ
jgi:catechol 2,3-dioxygenase-like lactoylglutathione lyase family enzyme